jgi:hypothetical protein
MLVIGMDKMTATLDREVKDTLPKARKTPRELPEVFAPELNTTARLVAGPTHRQPSGHENGLLFAQTDHCWV